MKVIMFFSKYILGVIGIVFISCLSTIFSNEFKWSISVYFHNVYEVLGKMITPSEWVFQYRLNYQYVEKPLFSYISDNYLYSMTVLFSALAIAIIVGLVLAISTFGLPHKATRGIHAVLNSLEALPDILFVFLLQMFVVWFFQTFDHLIFRFVYMGNEKVYLSPILSLCILPTVLFYRTCLLLLEEEWRKDYVILAKSKGLGNTLILVKHCLGNIKRNLVIQSKPILWLTLSSLLVIEYLHNIYGIVRLILFDTRPFVMAVALILIFTPFYLIYTLLDWVIGEDKRTDTLSSPSMLRKAELFHVKRSSFKGLLDKGASIWKESIHGALQLLKSPKFFVGIGYIIILLIISVFYDVPVENAGIVEDSEGNLEAPPHSWGEGKLIFGSNLNGYPVLQMLIVGAKYTILFTLLVALMRVVNGYIFSVPYIFWLGKRSKKVINVIADGMQFLPMTLVAYLLLVDVVIFDHFQREYAEFMIVPNIVLELTILIVFALPVLINTIGQEFDQILKKEYIQAAILLGASKGRIFFKHMTPHLVPRLYLLLGQQMIQVLQVLLHLGVLSVFLGGTIRGNREGASQSLIYEWTSLFETMRIGIMTERYWLIVPVLVLYVLLILSIQAVVKSLIVHQQRKIGINLKQKIKKSIDSNEDEIPYESKEMFSFVKGDIESRNEGVS
ncbi:ABC transporter permease subunit [Halobacillus trueperi]|uniref:ABC transporter permease subunit n=1 Tax=Halobacillus trueperi TaxID=156205 RepID=A0A3D8VT39_9BACI|nr:ABC transporter permease subunit [Halobacillus trueperi]RDY72594.1 ABC transporter permease subunit [Halobacillus trueperi]